MKKMKWIGKLAGIIAAGALISFTMSGLLGCTQTLDDEDERSTTGRSTPGASSGSTGESGTGDNVINGTQLTGTEWWSGAASLGNETLAAGSTITYTFTVEADGADCLVEAYDSSATAQYISTTSQKTAWGMSLINTGSQVTNLLKKGNIYTATVSYDGTNVFVVYKNLGTDGSGNDVLFVTGTAASVTAPITVHFDAEFGTFYVKSETSTSESIFTNFLSAFNNITITVPENTSFVKGATFNTNGVKVTGTYDTTELDLTYYATIDSSAVDMNTANTYTVTVTCGDKNKSYSVEVKAATVTAIEVTTAPTNAQPLLIKNVPMKLDLTGMVVTATYSDSTTGTVSNDEVTVSLPTAEGENSVTVTYGDFTAMTTVTVTTYINPSLCGYTGSYTSSAWWTEISSGDVEVASGGAVQTVFTNNSYGDENWSGSVYRIANSDSTAEYAVCRNDNYGWGSGYDNKAVLTSNWDWSSLKEDVIGSTEYVTLVNNKDGTVNLYLHFVKDGAVIRYQYYTGIQGTADSVVKFRPMGDAGADITYCEPTE